MRALFVLTLVLLLAGLSACTHAPRLTRSSEDVEAYRSEYLRNNPDGKYNQHILNSEVTKGMNFFEVLASWGLPHLRRGSRQTETESWLYYTLDEHTQHVMSYELVFESNTLTLWFVDNNAQGIGTLTPRDLIGVPGSAEERPEVGADTGTLKKKQ